MKSAVGSLWLRGVWLGLLALAAFSTPARADQLVATRFEMFGFAQMGVLTLRNRTEERGERYAITIDYATKGMASVFVNLTTHAEARGRLISGSAQPEVFRDHSRRNGVERQSRLDYRPDGAIDGCLDAAPADAGVGGRDARHRRQSDRLFPARAPARPHRQLRAYRARSSTAATATICISPMPGGRCCRRRAASISRAMRSPAV